MATLLRVPEVATGSTSAVLTEWLVAENARFAVGDPLAVLETDKAAVEVEAEVDAVLLRALVPGGANVQAGTPIAVLGSEAEAGDIENVLADLGVGPPGPKPERVFASPLARKLLKEAGMTPDQVTGSGPGGRIVRRDVDKAIAEPAPAAALVSTSEDVPLTRMRQAIARKLTESTREIPHFHVRRTARIDALLALREQLNEVSPAKISVNDLVVRAVGVAHTQVPDANVIWTGDGMTRYSTVDVGVAVASSRGLVTPVVRGVERSSPSVISRRIKELAQEADAGRLRQPDLEGGTITVSNLGMYGVDEFSAIINPPQSMILAVGAGKPAPVVVDGEIRVQTQMTLTVSVDHRAIDGALAAQWLAAVVTALEEPLRLLA
ncbi:dihydrolipoamide acetyltransferase family protein [Kibdelosporangium persicum]|uniref:Dihydrolipoamide acetyltransferase component of pyruvate dehydrogenase complex n=1 Tax=Kibdelosporangium persicum TaxID=2698649 RepID=A0ABX2F159_9PSEU|nr:dihydrolipoamide acetyltransferase family protein [Kibdelosporangium persicum]NRN65061.1 Dihydrolipoyllysine-residue acetyltransferase component of pyruvate dehydrogenase complex [Kibdelosporangium persicum]